MIRLEAVSRVFPMGRERVHALRSVDLRIGPGEYLALTGPSGSGKSTLLNVLGLLDTPTSGRYFFESRDTADLDDGALAALRRTRIGFVFQSFHLVPRLSAAENVALPLMLARMAPPARRARVAALLARFGLAERAAHKPAELSGGQRQRVAIARAMALEPSLLLADEPTGNLDRASGHDVIAALEALNAEGLTVVLVTHDPELAARTRRRIRLVDGTITQDAPP
jgi:putative ABC transport system ATP-binding protein